MMTRSMLAALGIAAVLLPASPAHADGDVDDFTFRSMDVAYTLGRDDAGESTLHVVETLVAEFPEIDQNRGIRRLIPDTYQGLSTHVDVLSVTDESGAEREWEDDSDDDFLAVTAAGDDYVHGEQTYVITYEMRGVTRHFADTGADEFYWDVNGTGWAQPFGDVTMTLRLEDGLADQLTGAMSCYRGAYGDDATCTISQDGDVVSAASGALEAGEGMTVAVAFEPATFTMRDTSYFAGGAGWVQVAAGLLGLGAVGSAVFARRRFMADEEGHPVIVPQYEPPAGWDAFAAAVLLGRPNGPTAELLEQAVRGSIRLVETARRLGKPLLTAVLINPAAAGDKDGHDLLVGLFGEALIPGSEYAFDGADDAFAAHVAKMTSRMTASLNEAGVRRKVPAGARIWPIVAIGVALTGGIVALVNFDKGGSGIVIGAAVAGLLALCFVAVIIIIAKRPYTRAGAETRDHLRGLETFMRWAEADRIRMLQSRTGAERVSVDARDMIRLYEPLLPYAVVFGIEKEWSGLVSSYYSSVGYTPAWFVGAHGFNAAALGSAVSATSSAMSTASTSSSSGGSGGGGFSGGGGGGGGGGGV